MRVKVLFFAHYRDLVGTDGLEVELPAGSTAAMLVDRLRAGGGRFARLPEAPIVAINLEYAPLGTPLSDGDEVALIPPVAGG
ncbi:MAG TPA: MoaD/ThiS family protein [Longimicrobiales bacterium]|nr:MoaD/ThiS family protein [Longimicrobiales bacterium]